MRCCLLLFCVLVVMQVLATFSHATARPNKFEPNVNPSESTCENGYDRSIYHTMPARLENFLREHLVRPFDWRWLMASSTFAYHPLESGRVQTFSPTVFCIGCAPSYEYYDGYLLFSRQGSAYIGSQGGNVRGRDYRPWDKKTRKILSCTARYDVMYFKQFSSGQSEFSTEWEANIFVRQPYGNDLSDQDRTAAVAGARNDMGMSNSSERFIWADGGTKFLRISIFVDDFCQENGALRMSVIDETPTVRACESIRARVSERKLLIERGGLD